MSLKASNLAKSPENSRQDAQQLVVNADGFNLSDMSTNSVGVSKLTGKINGAIPSSSNSMLQQLGSIARPFPRGYVFNMFNNSSAVDDSADGSTTTADPPFSWELYLAELNAAPVPLQAFPHVERAFQELVPKGSVVEVVWRREDEAASILPSPEAVLLKREHCYFWYARVVVSSAPLLLVRWLGLPEDDVCSEFWVDCEEGIVHSVGWRREFIRSDAASITAAGVNSPIFADKQARHRLYVPKKHLEDPFGSEQALPVTSQIADTMLYEMRVPFGVLDQMRTAWVKQNDEMQIFNENEVIGTYRGEAWYASTPKPEAIEEHHGIPPAERIIPGSYVDLLSEEEPTCAWPVKILDSAGGRLKLHYWPVGDTLIEQQWPTLRDGKTPQQFAEECEEDEFWVFCNSYLIRPLGSTGRYRIPDDLPECYRELLRNLQGTWHAGLKDLVEREHEHKLSADIFSYFEPDKNHNFQAGMRLESLNPINEKHIQPAYIGRVFDNGYVHLVYDDMEKYEWVEEDARERERAASAAREVQEEGCKHTCRCELHGCAERNAGAECTPECAALNARKDAAKLAAAAAAAGEHPSSTHADDQTAAKNSIVVSPAIRGPPLHTSVTKASLRILTFQNSTRMLPPYWSERNGVKLSKPSKWSTTRHGDFSWPRMIDGFGGQLAPRSNFKFVEQLITNPGFFVGSKLEAVNPEAPDEICTATIVRVIPPMLWIHIDSYGQSLTYMTPFDSTDIFPCGFCSMHNVKLHLPRMMMHGRRSAFVRSISNANLTNNAAAALPAPSTSSNSTTKSALVEVDQIVPRPILWRDIPIVTLYYNRGCSFGPFLIGKRMHTLHLQIGPGPLRYVLREFIRMMVNCHRSPPAALRMMAELGNTTTAIEQANADSSAAPSSSAISTTNNNSPRHEKIPLEMLYREKVLVKAKLKPRSETRAVPIVSQTWLVPDFIRQICIMFQACPSLYTTEKRLPDSECKESCDTFVRPNPRAAAWRRTARRPAVAGGMSTSASAANLAAIGAANSTRRTAAGKAADATDETAADDYTVVGAENDAELDIAAEPNANSNCSQPLEQHQQSQPEAPFTRSTRNRAKVSYQLMDKGISGDVRRQKFENATSTITTRRSGKDAAGKRKRTNADAENDADTSLETDDEDDADEEEAVSKRVRNESDADYQTADDDAEDHVDDEDADEISVDDAEYDGDETEGGTSHRVKEKQRAFQKKASNGSLPKTSSVDGVRSGKSNVLSPRTPIGTPTKNEVKRARGGKRVKPSGRAPLTLTERNDRTFLRELSALASNNQQLPLSQRRRVAEAAAASGKSFRSTVSQVGAGQYYDDNRAQAWMEFWAQCDYLDKVYVDKVRAKDPRLWTSQDVENFLVSKYGQHVSDIFTSDGIDGDLLMRLDMLGLRTLRVPSSVIPELMLEIEKLKVAFMYIHGDELTPDEWCTLTEHCSGQLYED